MEDIKEELKCAQINLKHSRVATANLMKYTADNKVDIICIQEPYINQGRTVGIDTQYKTFTAGEARSRAAVIITNRKVDATLITQLSDEDTIVLEITNGDTTIILASMYFDRLKPLEHDLTKVDAILQHAKRFGAIFAMDSNARSTTWHDTTTNNRGKHLEEYIISKQLHIMNEPSANTTFESRTGKSNIDLTLVTSNILRRIADWKISDEESNSDHSIIKYVIRTAMRHNNTKPTEQKYTVNAKSMEKYQGNICRTVEKMIREQSNNNSEDGLDERLYKRILTDNHTAQQIEEFSEAMRRACEQSFKTPKTPRVTQKYKSVPWWTRELTELRKTTNALRRQYQRTRDNADQREKNKATYHDQKSKYAATIKREKTKSWKEYCNLTTEANPWNAVYRLAAGKKKNNIQITTLRKPDGSLTKDTKETLRFMLEYFTPEDNVLEDDNYHKQVRDKTTRPPNTPDDCEFTIDEIRRVIEGLDNKKAPGEDGITAEIFKQTFKILPKSITAMYNGCLKNGIFPEIWKRAKIIPITKPDTQNSPDVTKYRPISLLNIGGKILEKALINRINHHMNSTEFLKKNQYGFIPQTSTIDAIMAVKTFVQEGFSRGEITVTVSLDVEGAFNSAWWPSVLKNLQESGCPRNLFNLTKNYFSQRKATLATNNITIERAVSRGAPQGACLGPGIWNIFYNSLLNLTFTSGTKIVAFADDLLLLARGKSVSEVENITNIELKKVSTWAKENKVCFNDKKSKVMLMTRRKRKERKDLEVYLNNKQLRQVKTMKYLGIIIDDKLTFREHITHVTEKCRKIIFALSKSAKLNWGLSHKALKTLYTGGIQPLLLYGAPVWANIIEKTSHRKKLTRVQRLINIKIAKAYRTVSNEALCIITGLYPIHLRIQETAELYKIVRGNRHKNLLIDHDKPPKKWLHPAARIIDTDKDTDDKTKINVYTDGSKSEQGVGAGIVITCPGNPTIKLMYRMDPKCTNNQAEAYAILKALEYLQNTQTNEDDKAVTVHSDSMTTLESLINTDIHTFLTEEIKQRVHEMENREWKIRFRWVKAHAGTNGNELADKLAKEASGKTYLPISYNRIPKSVIKKDLENTSVETWQREWDTTTKGSTTKEYFPNVEERLKMKLNLTHNFTTIVTGHGKQKHIYIDLKL